MDAPGDIEVDHKQPHTKIDMNDCFCQTEPGVMGVNGNITIFSTSGTTSSSIPGARRVQSGCTEDAWEHLQKLA
jgi:hypothetical protein